MCPVAEWFISRTTTTTKEHHFSCIMWLSFVVFQGLQILNCIRSIFRRLDRWFFVAHYNILLLPSFTWWFRIIIAADSLSLDHLPQRINKITLGIGEIVKHLKSGPIAQMKYVSFCELVRVIGVNRFPLPEVKGFIE